MKSIIAILNNYVDNSNTFKPKMLAWLEKQGEKNPITDFSDIRTWKYIVDAVWTEKEGIGQYLDSPFTEEVAKKLQKRFGNIEQKPADKVEPKFHEGEWVVFNDKHKSVYQIEKIENFQYTLRHFLGGSMPLSFSSENMLRLWTIQDAKDGDVLATDDDSICIFDGTVEEGKHPFAYCGLTRYGFESYDRKLPVTHNDVHPATKEQRDLLFAKMKEAGYEWNAGKKELKKIEQKSAWSEEDENIYKRLLEILCDCHAYGRCILKMDEYAALKKWLKSLRPQKYVGYNPYKATVESIAKMCNKYENWMCDETEAKDFLCEASAKCHEAVEYDKKYHQKQWKPSDEQMKFLHKYAEQNNYDGAILTSLYNDLKKLKGK